MIKKDIKYIKHKKYIEYSTNIKRSIKNKRPIPYTSIDGHKILISYKRGYYLMTDVYVWNNERDNRYKEQ